MSSGWNFERGRRSKPGAHPGSPVTWQWALCLALLPAFAPPARADEVVAVMDRERPDYDPKGLPLGAFRLYPGLVLGSWYDDNVFALDDSDDVRSDTYFTINPSVRLSSQWSRNAIGMSAGLTDYQYSDLTSENRDDWNVRANGRLDIAGNAYTTLSLGLSNEHEPRSSPDAVVSAKEPIEYRLGTVDWAANYRPGRVGYSAGATLHRYTYSSSELRGGGTIDNDDRDRNEIDSFLKVSYAITPDYDGFLRVTRNDRLFDQTRDRNNLVRDSYGYRVDAGTEFLLSSLVKGEAFVGYLQQNYDHPLPNISTTDFGLTATWFATPLVNLVFDASRSLADTTIDGASATNVASYSVEADYELLRNLILNLSVDRAETHFSGASRLDKTTGVDLGAEWLLNRYLNLHFTYRYSQRDSTDSSESFDRNLVGISLGLRL